MRRTVSDVESVPLRRVGVALLAVCLAAVTGGGCASRTGGPADKAALREANQLHAMLRPAVMDDRDVRLRAYLEQIGTRIVAAAKELAARRDGPAGRPPVWLTNGDARFHVVAEEIPNAFTLTGSHVYISSGLLAKCEGEDDLAAAFCHALAHAFGPPPAVEPGPPPDVVRDVIAVRRPASLDPAADDIGFALYTRAGWEPARYDAPFRGREPTARLAQSRQRVETLPPRSDDWRQTPVADPRRFAGLRLEAKTLADSTPRDRRAKLLIEAMPNCFLATDPPEVARARLELLPPPAAVDDNPWQKGPRPKPTP